MGKGVIDAVDLFGQRHRFPVQRQLIFIAEKAGDLLAFAHFFPIGRQEFHSAALCLGIHRRLPAHKNAAGGDLVFRRHFHGVCCHDPLAQVGGDLVAHVHQHHQHHCNRAYVEKKVFRFMMGLLPWVFIRSLRCRFLPPGWGGS